MEKLFIRPLFFSSDQEIIHNSLSSNITETSNAFPIAADIGHIKYPSIENISNLSNNESMANDIENSTNRLNYTYTNVNNISVLKNCDTINIQKQPDVNIVETPIELENNPNNKNETSHLIETYSIKTNNTDIENLTYTNDLNTKPKSNEATNKTHQVSDITEFKNHLKGTNEYKLMNKKSIFVGILVSLARKRLK